MRKVRERERGYKYLHIYVYTYIYISRIAQKSSTLHYQQIAIKLNWNTNDCKVFCFTYKGTQHLRICYHFMRNSKKGKIKLTISANCKSMQCTFYKNSSFRLRLRLDRFLLDLPRKGFIALALIAFLCSLDILDWYQI